MTGNCQLIAIDNCKWSELAAEELANDGEAVATLTKIKWDSAEKAQEAPENHTKTQKCKN